MDSPGLDLDTHALAATDRSAPVEHVAQVAHVALRLGRSMMANGADAAHTSAAMAALATRMGYRAHVLVCVDGLVLTLENEAGFRTKVGATFTGAAVNVGTLAVLADMLRRGPADSDSQDPAALDTAVFDRLPWERPGYPHWIVIVGVGAAAASLARLFGGAWEVVAVSLVVGMATQALRMALGRLQMNAVAGAAICAFVGGAVGAVGMRLFPGTSPTLCLVAAGMILVPGVPLLNGIRDTLSGHAGVGIARLLTGTAIVLAIALGLLLAAGLFNDDLPLNAPSVMLTVGEDFLFSALAGAGYALLFNVPPRMAWACIVCAMVGHGLRTELETLGVGLAAASLAAAFIATLLARALAHRIGVPAVTFAFPGVVAMIPGAYAFRAAIGGLQLMNAGEHASLAVVGSTIGLAVTAMVVTTAIAAGLCLALASFPSSPHRLFESKGVSR